MIDEVLGGREVPLVYPPLNKDAYRRKTMSLDKAIQHGKEKRKQYRGAKAVDPACRNHGDDDWSKSNRTIQSQRAEQQAKAKIEEARNEY